ncbi:formin-like protein 3 isoform X4 [Lotus japonicus]|uniref:formin-like protein 3 isoform X4 n=1 Tax=Lotus japonicus TaxID=34305 RepID=UPI00258D16FA|nr:formin-like protein 3 isoform X4 [Lotus japonicus]
MFLLWLWEVGILLFLQKVRPRQMGRAYNREIMLSTIKKTLPDMIKAILALDSSVLDIDQVENLIKLYPTKEEIEMLKNYTGDKEMLGKCEQFFMELIKVPRIESKLWVYAFKINFFKKVSDLEENLKIANGAVREVKASVKLAEIMLTMLTLDNGFALNQGTSQGSAIDFKLEILLKFSDNRARNDKRTLMHDLCQLLAEKKPELLDFYKDFVKLEKASKIQLKAVADGMQVLCEDLEKVDQELHASETEFYKVLKTFLDDAEAKMGSLVSSYTNARRFADSLSRYFGANPATCPFEKVTQILVTFVKMFKKTREENKKQGDAEKENLHAERGNLRVHEGQDIMCVQ